MRFQKISLIVKAKIGEIAKERNISEDLTKEITNGVMEILEKEGTHIEAEKTELEGYVRCLEVNFETLTKTIENQMLKCKKLLKENIKLRKHIETLEGKSLNRIQPSAQPK